MSETPFTYKTIAAPTTGFFKDRGSKFLAFSYPVQSVETTKEVLRTLKKEHPKAVHHCFAFKIGTDGNLFRMNDDGEPSGSAGKPIFGQIERLGLTNVLVVVVRYFGGTLLGVPGLINAYKTAAAESLEQAEIVEKNVELMVNLSFDYSLLNEVMVVLKQFEANIERQKMLLFCDFLVGIPLRDSEACLAAFREIHGLEVAVCE